MGDVKRVAKPDWLACACSREVFIQRVWEYGEAYYRDLPWRNVDDAYAVLVSEVMLQQTQVARVLKYWSRWMAAFPTVDALASVDTATVLEAWQGLGYNRRALALKRACEECSANNGGKLPLTAAELVGLPGIGPATAAGIVAFAHNRPSVYVETNVRSVFLHELFPAAESVSDRVITPFVADTCPNDNPRGWYYALLDYGAHLKAQGVNPSRRSAHYTRQSAFEGSHRQKRSSLLKLVLAAPEGIDRSRALAALNEGEAKAKRSEVAEEQFAALVAELVAEGFFHEEGSLLIP